VFSDLTQELGPRRARPREQFVRQAPGRGLILEMMAPSPAPALGYETMTPSAEHPAAPYDRPVAELRTRATLALVALAATMLARAWDFGARQWSIGLLQSIVATEQGGEPASQAQLELADQLVNLGAFAINALLLVTAIVFLRWVHRLVTLTRALGAPDLRWTPSQAVWGFIIPFVSLVRPYQVLRDVQQRLDPEEVAPPAPRLERDLQADYRSSALVLPPRAKALTSSLLGLWWGSFIAMSVVARLANAFVKGATTTHAVVAAYHSDMLASGLAVVAAALCMQVVRSLTARLEERFRRIRHATTESLVEQRVFVGER
jgi:hypothetical protein